MPYSRNPTTKSYVALTVGLGLKFHSQLVLLCVGPAGASNTGCSHVLHNQENWEWNFSFTLEFSHLCGFMSSLQCQFQNVSGKAMTADGKLELNDMKRAPGGCYAGDMAMDQELTSHWHLQALPKTVVSFPASCTEKCLRATTLLQTINFHLDIINLFISQSPKLKMLLKISWCSIFGL